MYELVIVKSRILESHVVVVIIIARDIIVFVFFGHFVILFFVVCLDQGPLEQSVGRTDTVFDWLIALTRHVVSSGCCPLIVYRMQYPVSIIGSFSIHLFFFPTLLSILPPVPKILRTNSAPLARRDFLLVNPWQGSVKEPIFGANSR